MSVKKGDSARHLARYLWRYKTGLREGKLKIIDENMPNLENVNVLDMGCGSGIFSIICHRRGGNVVSVDVSEAMVKHLQKTHVCMTVQTSGRTLPFRNGVFGVVLALDVIEHLSYPLGMLKEIRRVLKKEGVLLLTTDNIRTFITQRFFWAYSGLIQRIGKGQRKEGDNLPSTHIKDYTTNEIIALLEKQKFIITKYDTYISRLPKDPIFQFAKAIFDFLLRGRLRQYKWNSVFLCCRSMSCY